MAIQLNPQETEEAVASLKKFFAQEMDEELSDLRAGLLLDYVVKDIGPLAYNQGVAHAERFFRRQVEDLPSTCFEAPFTYWSSRRKR